MWGNFPEERQRLFDLIRKCESSGVVILSGDRHLGEISCDMEAVGYPLFDVTASGLNQGHQGWRSPEPNSKRYAALPFGNHFGTIEIDWESSSPMVSLQLRKEDGRIGVEAQVPVNMLVAEPAPLPIPAGVASAKEVLEKSVGDDVVVQFYVRGGRDLTRPKRVLLNSERVIENPNNLTVVLQEGSLAGANSQANLQTYLHKTIRASGKVTLYNGRKQIEVLRAEDIDVIAR
jgi:alkaline phosphatase D